QPADRDARPFADDLGDVLGIHLFLYESLSRGHLLQGPLLRRQLALQVWEGAVPQARRRLQVGPPLRLLDLVADLLNLLLGLPDRGDPPLLLLPLLALAAAALFPLGNLLLQRREPFPARGVIFLPQGLALRLQLHPPPVDLIELGRLAVNLHPQPAGRLVDQVDRLVGEV